MGGVTRRSPWWWLLVLLGLALGAAAGAGAEASPQPRPNSTSWLTRETHAATSDGPEFTNGEQEDDRGNKSEPTGAESITPGSSPTSVNVDLEYEYDLRGNREEMTVHAGGYEDATYEYDAEDRLTEETRGTTVITYEYTKRGDLIKKEAVGSTTETTDYYTDHLGRITTVSTPTDSWSYKYAPTGDRIGKWKVSSSTVNEWQLPSGGDALCDYTRSSGTTDVFTGAYISPGIDGRLGRVNGSGDWTYTFGDALQSAHQVTDGSGDVERETFTDAWGNSIQLGSSPPGTTGPGDRYGFQGRESDTESGLMHFRARSYDPMTGRFTSRDPVPYPNLYFFVNNDPVNKTDPSGRDVWESDYQWLGSYESRLDQAESAGDAEAYGRLYNEALGWAQGVVARQGKHEYLDAGEARDRILGPILARNSRIKGENPAAAEQARAAAATQQVARGAYAAQESFDDKVEWTLWGLDKAGTFAGFAVGGGAIINTLKTAGVKAGGVILAKEGGKALLKAGAQEGALWAGGEAAKAMGADAGAVEDTKRYVDAGSSIFGLTKGLRQLKRLTSWGRMDTLDDHFKRHGGDFGAKSMDEYAGMSGRFFKGRSSYLQKVEGGVTRVYDPATNTFGAYNSDGTARTFFKPTGGLQYWNTQPGTSP